MHHSICIHIDFEASAMTSPSKLISVILLVQTISLVTSGAAAAAAAGPEDLIGGLIDHLTCTRTTNRGYKGRCIPRACCATSLGVQELCTDPEYTCCYGGDVCTSGVGGSGAVIDKDLDRFGPNERYPSDYDERRCSKNVVRRFEWNAAPTRERVRPLHRRLEHVIVHHTEDGERSCWSFEECRRYLQHTQRRFQHRKSFPDIPWNFLIGENGEVFEGMGWGVEGYHTESWNDRSLGIAFIGDFDTQSPTPRAVVAFERLLDCGVRSGYLDSYYGVYGHRDMRDTDCPGDLLYETIRHMKAFQQYGKSKRLFGFIERAANVTRVHDADRSAKYNH